MKPHIEEIEIEEVGYDSSKEVKSTIDEKSMGWIINRLSNLYSDPIGSIVREITSNCHDSHVDAGVPNKPIVVGLDRDDDFTEFIFFKDQGLGLDHEDMLNIYVKLGNSTKRDRDHIDGDPVMGAYGVGSKSPLSFCTSYRIETIKNGVAREYTYFKTSDYEPPTLSEPVEYDTNEPNGVTIKINLVNDKYDSWWDNKRDFKNAFSQQLRYFENVYFYSKDASLDDLNSDYKIYEYNTFKYRTGSTGKLHMNYGKASYNIDFDKLFYNINQVMDDDTDKEYRKFNSILSKMSHIPIGLKVPLDKVTPTPERERIEYTKESIEYLRSRILECYKELENLYNAQNTITDDIFEYLNKLEEDSSGFIQIDKFTRLNVENIFDESFIKYHLIEEGVINRVPTIDQLFALVFRDNYKIDKGRRLSKYNRPWFKTNNPTNYLNDKRLIIGKKNYKNDTMKNKFIGNALIFRKSTYFTFKRFYKEANVYFQMKYRHGEFIGRKGYYLGKSKNIRKVYYDILRNFKNISENYDDIIVPQSFIDANQTERVEIDKSKFIIHRVDDSFNKKDWRINITFEELKQYKGFIVYGTPEQEEFLKKVQKIFPNKSMVIERTENGDVSAIKSVFNCYMTSNRNQKYFEMLNKPNIMSVEEFAEGKTNIFIDTATAYLIQKTLKSIECQDIKTYSENRTERNSYYYQDSKYDSANSFIKCIRLLNTEIYDTYNHLREFVSCRRLASLNEEFFESMLTVCSQNKLFNFEMIAKLNKFKDYINGLEMLKHIHYNGESMQFIVDYAKSKGKRLDLNHYRAFYDTAEKKLYLEGMEKQLYLSFIKSNEDKSWEQVKEEFKQSETYLKIA